MRVNIQLFESLLNLFGHALHFKQAKGAEEKLKEVEKAIKSGDLETAQKLFTSTVGYIDENLYSDAVDKQPVEKRRIIDKLVNKLLNDEEFGGKKIRDNFIKYFASEPDLEKRADKLEKLIDTCGGNDNECYERLKHYIKARGIRTPETEIEEKFKKLVKKYREKLATNASTIEEDLSGDATGPLSRFRNRMRDKYLNQNNN